MVQDPAPADVFALLDDEYARGILKATRQSPMSAPELAADLDASRPTIYRRIDQLQALDLLTEATEVGENGHHRSVYQATLKRITIELEEHEFAVTVDQTRHPADRLTDMWGDL